VASGRAASGWIRRWRALRDAAIGGRGWDRAGAAAWLHGRTGADRTGADLTGADLTGADRTGDDRTGDDRTGDDRTGADRTGADRTGD